MKNNNLAIAYTYDFLSLLLEDSKLKNEIKEIVLFGSIAKNTADEKSDVDLFFNINNKEEEETINNLIRKNLKSFQIKAERTWKLKSISLPISFIVGKLEEEKWKNLREEIISSGITLYSKYKEYPEKLNQKYIIYYSLSSLSSKDKMKFIRTMFGYSTKKGSKEYKQKGLLEEKSGIKLSQNVIIIERDALLEIKKLFSDLKVNYKILESWVRI